MIKEIHKKYESSSKENIFILHKKYVKRNQETVAEALTAALAVNGIFSENHIDLDAITPKMQEAFDISFPK